jgi:hypothetical protein
MVIEKFASVFFQHSLTMKNNSALTIIVARISHAANVRRQAMWDWQRRVCGDARPLA